MMKGILVGAAALALVSSVAVAEPLKMSEAEMGEVAGGFLLNNFDLDIQAFAQHKAETTNNQMADANSVQIGKEGGAPSMAEATNNAKINNSAFGDVNIGTLPELPVFVVPSVNVDASASASAGVDG